MGPILGFSEDRCGPHKFSDTFGHRICTDLRKTQMDEIALQPVYMLYLPDLCPFCVITDSRYIGFESPRASAILPTAGDLRRALLEQG